MNKNKKIAMAVVATVMAGTMVVPLAACNNGGGNGEKVDLGTPWKVIKDNGDLDYSVYTRETPVTLNIGIGYEKNITSTSFVSGSTYTLADGNTYTGGAMKPAWAQMGKDLNITWNDVFAAKKTSANLDAILTGDGYNLPYAQVDMFTTDLSVAVSKASSGTDILNLADYLDYMPNFKNFLEANPVVYLSLLQDGMSTTDGSGKSLYIAPYFDGNDDIERYCIIRQDWTALLLDGDGDLAAGTALGKAVAVQPFMPGTGSLAVDITSPTDHNQVTKVYKNYANVLAQIKATGDTALKSAYQEAANGAYTGDSGNIVAIMNAAIGANSGVTGDKLVKLFRAYIDACYTKTANGTESHYTKRSDLFNGYDAAWDVDDLVAMLRCIMTNQSTLLSTDEITDRNARKIYGIAPREGNNDRTPDMVRLACQLYGVRGADSRYEYTYIDKNGNLQDARNDKGFYEALDRFNRLREEGLIADYSSTSFNGKAGYVYANKGEDVNKNSETFMMYDYCQTQTQYGFPSSDRDMPDNYNFAPILTPVSKWDVDGNGSIDNATEVFRFTESWRSTKTSGLALNGNLAYNKDKLIAALQFVDYLYSEDGQIVSTFGPMAENADGKNGFWYGEVQNDPKTKKDENNNDVPANYFTYKGVKYQGYPYKGTVAPKITDAVYRTFQGIKKDKDEPSLPENVKEAVLSFTNYARFLIGSTLPVGVKNQAFEDQLTSACGKAGSAKVAAALSNVTDSGYTVIRGMSLKMDPNNWWYTCVPTGLPIPASFVITLGNSNMLDLRYLSGESKDGKKLFHSIFNTVILQGAKAYTIKDKDGKDVANQHNEQGVNYVFTDVDGLLKYMSEDKLAGTRETVLSKGWDNAKDYWNYLKPAK